MKTKLHELHGRAQELAGLLNSAEFTGDRWSLSMELSGIYKRLGAIGIGAVSEGAENEEEC